MGQSRCSFHFNYIFENLRMRIYYLNTSTNPYPYVSLRNSFLQIFLQLMTISFKMSKFYTFALVYCLIIIGSTITRDKKEHPKTIVQSNHFYSATEKRANYDIKDIQSGKPLVLLLKKDEKKSNYVTDFEISLTSGAQTIDCNFKKITDLCIIPNTTTTSLNMIIECKTLPCQVSWIIYQPQAKDPNSNQIALNLFTLHDSNDHLIGQITCNDPAVSTLDQDITVYSETPYRRVYKNNVLYVLFNNQQKGYVFIDIDQKSRACSQISFKQSPSVLSPSINSTTDFVVKQSPVSYEITQVPNSDFRIECASIRMDTIKELKSSMTVVLYGLNGSDQKEITKHSLAITQSRTNDFTIAFKKPSEKYERLKVVFQVTTNQIVIIDTRLAISDTHEAELGQIVFFSLKKNQSMSFKIEGNDQSQDTDMIYLVPRQKNELNFSKESCKQKQECDFTVTAVEDTQNMIYVSGREMNSTSIDEDGQGIYQFQEIQFIPITKKAQRKIRVGDNLFFKKRLKKDQSIQVHINSPNVIMYAACQSKCDVPDERCRERTGNYHHPFIFQAKDDCDFLINVEGLQNAQFEISIIEEQKFISLQDGTPFGYTMDSHQDRIDFQFKLKQKSDVSFNLVAPLSTLKLLVSNEKEELPDPDTSEQSTDGYIFIEKNDIKGLHFVVSVLKMKEASQFFTHFTLIVSTKHTKIRLDPSVTSYETLLPSNYRQFVFQFDPSENYILNFYIYNLKEQHVNLEVKISDQQKKWEKAQAMTITKESDYLDLREVAATLCEEEGSISCEIFLRIANKMEIQVDISVTLLMKNAILQLKDGIWQAFPENLLTASTNFYFYPRHQHKNVYVSYQSSYQQLRIAYHLWKYDAQTINPTDWPFPKAIKSEEQLHANYKPNNYIMIDHEQMKNKCWPTCLLLISFYVDYSSLSGNQIHASISPNQQSNFKIMASNNHIQLLEKQKMSLTVAKDEQKYLLIDLKYILDKSSMSFYSSSIIGDCFMNANVYTQQHSICPIEAQPSDFYIFWGSSGIMVKDVKAKIQQKGMENDNNKYLCISIRSQASCKMSIQYTTDGDGFKIINFDSFEEIVLGNQEVKYYQVSGIYEQSAKITRMSGFPFVLIKKCPNKDQHLQCMDDFKNNQDKGKQIVVKTESFTQEACPDCIFLFKFSTMEPSKINFHLQSKYSQIELKQKVILSDFLNQAQQAKYMIQVDAKQDLIVNIHIQEGDAEVQLTNLNNVNLNKKSDAKSRILHFVVKSQEIEDKTKSQGLINPMAYSNHIAIYHLTIKSIDPTKATTYTISYSSGKRETYLQDGLILDQILEPNKPATFYYFNELTSLHIFYTLSMDNAALLNQLKIKTYYLDDPNDLQTKHQIQVEKPGMNRKTPNPAILFSLPAQNYFMFELVNPSSKQVRVSMGINHQEVILLPFDHEFPFQLHKSENLNILVDVNIPGFLEMSIKKCDRSEPSFAYSFDYDGFMKEEFMYNSKLTEQPYYHYTIKANRIGTLYVNFKADIDEDSIISLKVTHSEEKSKGAKMKAGKKGILSYELSQNSAKVTIPVAGCGESPCKGIKYYYMSSKQESQLYSQLVCSSSFFSTAGFNSSTPLTLYKIDGKADNKTLIFDFPLKESTYLGIKAVSDSGEEVFYQPIQIASLWQKWTKVSIYERILMVFLVSLCLCICIIFVRRASRKGYRSLDESQE